MFHLCSVQELQKHTDETHADFKAIEDALVQMKEAASFVNEMQRQKENQRMIAELQSSIEGWEVSIALPLLSH